MKRSNLFEMVIVGTVAVLVFIFQNVFGNVFYGWLKFELEKLTGVLEADFIAKSSQILTSTFLAIAIAYFLYRYIHRELTIEFFGRRNEERLKLWKLREEGVALRNRGLETMAAAAWEDDFNIWRTAVLKQADIVSMDLRHALDPLDKLPQENTKHPDPKHRMLVSIASEILVRIKAYLDRTA